MSELDGALQSTVICTLGMHRSGTSLTARMLNLLGVELGPQEAVLTSAYDNPTGYWEHRPIVDINDEILSTFGGRWDELPAYPSLWLRDPRIVELAERARKLLDQDFAAEPLWGWKDPRTCLTLPFWQELVGRMRYVICVRNPGEVVASLSVRDHMSVEKASALWLAHMHASLAHTSGQPRMLLFYEDALHDPAGELRRLAAFIGRPEQGEDPRVQADVGQFLERELRHHRLSEQDLLRDARVPFPVQAFYLALRGTARLLRDLGDQAPLADRTARGLHGALDLLGARALEAWQRTGEAAREREGNLHNIATLQAEREGHLHTIATLQAERESHLHTIGTLQAERESHLHTIGTLQAERESHLHTIGTLQAERESHLHTIGTLQTEHESRLHTIATLHAEGESHLQALARVQAELESARVDQECLVREIDAHAHALREVHASSAWKLVMLSKRALAVPLPPGTVRRSIFDSVLWRATGRSRVAGAEPECAESERDRMSLRATACFCTLAIHAPYRSRARLLFSDVPSMPWIVLTDAPEDFADLPVRAVRHAPTGPMAVDYLARIAATGNSRGAAAYHDKRFALQRALQEFDTAIFLDADSRIESLPPLGPFPPGLAILPVVRSSIATHLQTCGTERLPAFVELARELTGSEDVLSTARWCQEAFYAVTKDGNEARFFEAWDRAARFLQERGVYSGEGGVMGLAAACAGWTVDDVFLAPLGSTIRHEGGGPKAV